MGAKVPVWNVSSLELSFPPMNTARSESCKLTFRPFDATRTFRPPGHFAPRTFHPLTGRLPPTVDVSPHLLLYVCCFLDHQNVMDGWTDRIAINISHKCGDMQ